MYKSGSRQRVLNIQGNRSHVIYKKSVLVIDLICSQKESIPSLTEIKEQQQHVKTYFTTDNPPPPPTKQKNTKKPSQFPHVCLHDRHCHYHHHHPLHYHPTKQKKSLMWTDYFFSNAF